MSKFNKPEKIDFSILPIEGVQLLMRAARQGADKYGKRNWLEELDNPRIDKILEEAIHRHYIKSFYEVKDEESGASHEEHMALNILIRLARKLHRVHGHMGCGAHTADMPASVTRGHGDGTADAGSGGGVDHPKDNGASSADGKGKISIPFIRRN